MWRLKHHMRRVGCNWSVPGKQIMFCVPRHTHHHSSAQVSRFFFFLFGPPVRCTRRKSRGSSPAVQPPTLPSEWEYLSGLMFVSIGREQLDRSILPVNALFFVTRPC